MKSLTLAEISPPPDFLITLSNWTEPDLARTARGRCGRLEHFQPFELSGGTRALRRIQFQKQPWDNKRNTQNSRADTAAGAEMWVTAAA